MQKQLGRFDFSMRHIKLLTAYDGTDFCGWQVQPDAPSVQGTLAQAIGRITGERVLPQGSGRTDAGVHALAQVASFRSESVIPLPNLVIALNDVLPTSIRVLEASEVAADFHPRNSAKSKIYRYRIYREAICPPFLARYVWHYPYLLQLDRIADAAQRIEGEHDFTSFAAADPEKTANGPEGEPAPRHTGAERSKVRMIFSSVWRREGAELVYEVRGNGFLHHMVRNLVGTFLLVGKGTIRPDDVTAILTARNRSLAGPTAPACGLYLVKVEY